MSSKNKAHFAKLGTSEVQDLFELLVKQQIDLTLWQKQGDAQEAARATDLDFPNNALIIKGFGLDKLKGTELLVNFRFANRMYFSTAVINDFERETKLTFASDIFKCEQRRSFRLSTTSNRKIEITLDGQCFEAINVSVTGIGIFATLEQCSQFKVGSGYDNALLQIANHQFTIPFCKIIHLRSFYPDKKSRIVGIEFIEIPQALEIELYRTINNLLYQELKG